jgi:hypothetical protein
MASPYAGLKFTPDPPAPGGAANPYAGLTYQEDQAPGSLEALGRGALQGATLGFGDELGGLVESMFGPKSYEQYRDEIRANNNAAQAAHPYLYGGGELAGGLATSVVPGLGAIEGAGALGTVAHAAALGGISGIGASDASNLGGIAKDAAEGAVAGGVTGAFAHGAGKLIGGMFERAPAAADEQTIKALAQGEGKAGASWSKTRGMVDSPDVPRVINEPTQVDVDGKTKTLTLADIASRPAEDVRPVVKQKMGEIGDATDKIYDKADKTSGGTSVAALVNHLDEQISERSNDPGNKAFVNALKDIKNDVLDTWGSRTGKDGVSLKDALNAKGADDPRVQAALLKQYDIQVPSRDVRKFATTLQDRGSDTVDRLNPGLGSQVKKEMGTVIKDFVNDHVENVLGTDDAAALKDLNRRQSALYRIDDVLEAREQKEAAGRISGKGLVNQVVGHGSLVGAGLMAMHGNLPGAAAAIAIPKVLEKAPAVARAATRAAARGQALLGTIIEQAKAGNPWAAKQLQILRSTPQGLARLAALQTTAPAASNLQGP